MLKKLRIKFVLVTMLATMLVLFAIIGGINIKNWIAVNKNSEKTLALIVDNGGNIAVESSYEGIEGAYVKITEESSTRLKRRIQGDKFRYLKRS